MPHARLTRTVVFSAAHRYFRPDWDAAANARAFGTSAREHGHTYRCRVTVRGPLHPETSMVMDIAELDAILRREVVDVLDHRHLNHDVEAFAFGKTVPTGEALAVHIWERVAAHLPAGVCLQNVRVEEDPQLYAEYCGE